MTDLYNAAGAAVFTMFLYLLWFHVAFVPVMIGIISVTGRVFYISRFGLITACLYALLPMAKAASLYGWFRPYETFGADPNAFWLVTDVVLVTLSAVTLALYSWHKNSVTQFVTIAYALFCLVMLPLLPGMIRAVQELAS